MSQIEPTSDQERIEVKAEPVLVEPKSREIELLPRKPQTLTWLGAALAFAGREIVPRLAALLLEAWDRRAGRSASSASDLASECPASPAVANLGTGGGQRHRQRRRGQ